MDSYPLALALTSPLHAYTTLKFFQGFYGTSKDKKIELFSFLAYGLLSYMVFFFTRIPIINLLITILCLYVLSFNYSSTALKRMMNTFYIYTMMLLIELFVAVALGNTTISAIEGGIHDDVIELYLVRLLTLLVGYALFKRRRKEVKQADLIVPSSYYLAIGSVLIGTLYLFVAPFLGEKFTSWHVIIGGGVLIFIYFVILVLDEKVHDVMELYEERSTLKQLIIAYENQVEIMAQSRNSLEVFRHDIKNHMSVLHSLYSSGREREIEPYLQAMIKDLEGGAYSRSNHFVIDSIINLKLNNLKNSNTLATVEVNIPEELFILSYDLTVIFGNLIDNAITAVEKIKDGFIHLEVTYKKGNLFIFLDNSFDGKLCFEEGIIMSTKGKTRRRGLGLERIEKIVKKYDGQLDIDFTENIFSTSIILPAEESE